ncbi:PAS domain S-box-containing protein [Prosthecobacter fusiformis]|uniref:histidine kinase n=1 Tax=Prosthecobacter fusiformis TaxID=48464 RepID=A0A4R7RUE8_9BACT|nr:response regulator [Prosthecobacter fusiformis]TDU69310.1 PAS domain S-box-containing protein [Prosthecobacter fusiformis]
MAPASPLQVLIVDDSMTDCVIFRRHLSKGVQRPYEISEVATAAEAMKRLEQLQPDCVLMDFNLPDSDGVSLVKKLVATYGQNAFGIVMLTSSQDVELAVEAMQSGAHDFLPKNSASAIVLRRAVENAAEKAAIQRQLESQRQAMALQNEELERHIHRLEREAAERQLAESRLRQSEQQLRVVTDHAAVLLALCDQECTYKFVNRPYAQRFGMEPEQVIGKKLVEVLGTDAYEAILPHLQNVLAGDRVEFEIEIPYETLGRRWMNVVYVPERALDGTVQGLIGVMSDTTARKLAEFELEHARDEALAASRAKDDFLAALSHELRTPLNPILLLSSDAASDPSIPVPIRAIFETIRKNVDLEARLIDDLLNITRISRGKMALDKLPVDVHVVLRDAFDNVAAEIVAKHLSLRVNLNAHAHTVMGDDVRLQQVFWNVLKNAVKFTPEGGAIIVTTQTLLTEDVVEIRIEDTGIGMSAPELERIFDAFAQGDHAGVGGSHRFGGLGLGLAISQMLVKSHAGSILAESTGPGEGAAFVIKLPLVPDICLQLQPATPAESIRAKNDKPVEILLVEDHEATRTALAQLLQRRRYLVSTASCVDEARLLAREKHFDLLISDIGLPDGNGYDLMVELAQQYGLKGIALTGYGMEKDLDRSSAAGFVTHLTKPIHMNSLEGAIQMALAHLAK